MRMKGATFGFESDFLTNSLDLGRERSEWLPGFDGGPQRSRASLFKSTDTADPHRETLCADSRKLVREIIGKGPIHFSYEPQCQMQLLLILPAKIAARVHRVDQ